MLRHRPRQRDCPRHCGTAGVWTVPSGRDHAARAETTAVPRNPPPWDDAWDDEAGGMVDPSMSHHLYVGVDIAADTLAVAGLPAGGVPPVPFTGDRRPRRALRRSSGTSRPRACHLEQRSPSWRRPAIIGSPSPSRRTRRATGSRWSTRSRRTISPRRSCAGPRPPRRTRRTSPAWQRSSTPPRGRHHRRCAARPASDQWRVTGCWRCGQQACNQRHALLQWPVVVAGVGSNLDELIADLAPARRQPGGRARGLAQHQRVGGVAGVPDQRARQRARHGCRALGWRAQFRALQRPGVPRRVCRIGASATRVGA